VRTEKANTREPSFKCRNSLDDIKTGDVMLPRDEPIGNLLTGWVVSGIEMARTRFWLLDGTAGTCVCDEKGEDQELTAQGPEYRSAAQGRTDP
jgi:hypothetical protein